MIERDQVDAVIERIRPFLRADGGDVELVDVHGNSAEVRLSGACASCAGARTTLPTDIELAVRQEIAEFESVQVVDTATLEEPVILIDSILIGRSSRMRTIFQFVTVAGASVSTVLITGESGTGKEVTAALIHRSSTRKSRPFVPVSCALFSETLIESELFGHERGAFTGAVRDRPGRFEMAEGGTIFLDDIDDVPLSMQVKLLRVLQNRTIERLGGARPIPIDVRIIAGSKRDIGGLVADGRFRDDLYYRLNVLPIVLPPLRERREDIPLLMEHFLRRYFRRRGAEPPTVSDTVKEVFTRYRWPGNVRELENACERIAQTCTCGLVRVSCVPAAILFRAVAQSAGPSSAEHVEVGLSASLDERVRAFEARLIDAALEASQGNKSRAAELLHIKRSTLGDRINRCRVRR